MWFQLPNGDLVNISKIVNNDPDITFTLLDGTTTTMTPDDCGAFHSAVKEEINAGTNLVELDAI